MLDFLLGVLFCVIIGVSSGLFSIEVHVTSHEGTSLLHKLFSKNKE